MNERELDALIATTEDLVASPTMLDKLAAKEVSLLYQLNWCPEGKGRKELYSKIDLIRAQIIALEDTAKPQEG